MKNCSVCGTLKEFSAFTKQKECRNGVRGICKACHLERTKAWKAKNITASKHMEFASLLKTKYGMTTDHFEWLHEEQAGLCAICNKPETAGGRTRLSVDHDHTCGTIRGLLCHNCNTGLGKFMDQEELLLKAAEYLKMRKSLI